MSRVSSAGADFTDGGRIEFQVVEETAVGTLMSVCKGKTRFEVVMIFVPGGAVSM